MGNVEIVNGPHFPHHHQGQSRPVRKVLWVLFTKITASGFQQLTTNLVERPVWKPCFHNLERTNVWPGKTISPVMNSSLFQGLEFMKGKTRLFDYPQEHWITKYEQFPCCKLIILIKGSLYLHHHDLHYVNVNTCSSWHPQSGYPGNYSYKL